MAGHGWPTIANTDKQNAAMHAILFKASFDYIAQYARDTSAASVPMAVFIELHDSYNDLSAKQAGHQLSADSEHRLTRIENTLVEMRTSVAAPRARTPSPPEYTYAVTSSSNHEIPSYRVGSKAIIHRTCNIEEVDPRNGKTIRASSLDSQTGSTSSTWYPCVNSESGDAALPNPNFESSNCGRFVAISNDVLMTCNGLIKEESPIMKIPSRVMHNYPQYDHAQELGGEEVVSTVRKRMWDAEEVFDSRGKAFE